MKRIFVAIKIYPGEELIKMISSFQSSLNDQRIKWTDHDNLHITLVFIGDAGDEKIAETDKIIRQICTGLSRFELNIRGAGIFRNFRDLKVIWTGIEESSALIDLNRELSRKLMEAGVISAENIFSPHITLGRIKRITETETIRQLVDKFRDRHMQTVKVEEIILFESILRPEGPVYKPLGKYPLR